MKKFTHIAAASALLMAGNASAAIINGSFESGLTGWMTVGNVTQSSAWSTDGNFSALLTADTAIADVEAGLGLAAGQLDAITNNGLYGGPTNGAAIYQDITVNAGDLITFDFNFIDTEATSGSLGFNDTAIALFENGLLSAYFLASSLTTSTTSGSGIFSSTMTGTAQLSFISFNQGDFIVTPSLYIDNVSGSTASVVPVPAAVWLFGSGLLGLVGIARRRA